MAELADQLAHSTNGRVNGQPIPPPGQEELTLLKFLDGLDVESTTAQKDRVEQWEEAIALFKGKIWPVQDRQPFFSINALAPLVDKQASLLSDAKPGIKVMNRRLGLEGTAKVLQKTLDAGWDEYHMSDVMDEVGYALNLLSSSFLRIEWDPLADFGLGDFPIKAVDPRMVRFDPSVTRARDLHDAQYVIEDKILPLWQVQKRYFPRGVMATPNVTLKALRGEATRSTRSGGLKSLLQYFSGKNQDAIIAEGAVPRVHVRCYYFRDPTLDNRGAPAYPTGRVIVRHGNGDLVLSDTPNPYWDGGWPLVMCDNRFDPDSPWGRPEILAFQRIQESINRLGHMFVENTILSGNVWVTMENDAISPDLARKLTNIGAIVLPHRVGRKIERSEPPQMPSHFLDFIKLALGLIDELSGVSESGISGRGRVELRSGEQLEGLQNAAHTLVRALARRIEGYLERLGHLWISRIFQYYTSDRLLTYLGPGTEWDTYKFEHEMLMQEIIAKASQRGKSPTAEDILVERARAHQAFLFRVVPGSSLSTIRVQRARLYAELAQQSMVSRVKVLEELGIPNPEHEIDRAMKEAQMMNPGPSAPAAGDATPTSAGG